MESIIFSNLPILLLEVHCRCTIYLTFCSNMGLKGYQWLLVLTILIPDFCNRPQQYYYKCSTFSEGGICFSCSSVTYIASYYIVVYHYPMHYEALIT